MDLQVNTLRFKNCDLSLPCPLGLSESPGCSGALQTSGLSWLCSSVPSLQL